MTVKRCSTSLEIMEMQIKIMRYIPSDWQQLESDNTQYWESKAIGTVIHHVGGSVNQNDFEKHFAIIKLNICIPCNPAIPFLGILQKHLHTCKHETSRRALSTELFV